MIKISSTILVVISCDVLREVFKFQRRQCIFVVNVQVPSLQKIVSRIVANRNELR